MQATLCVISNLEGVLKRVENASLRSCHNPKEVELLVVTKYADNQDVLTLLKAEKINNIAETKVQDAVSKWNCESFLPYRDKVKKHFIGHLQSNKIKKAVEFFDFIDTVDNLKTAHILDEKAAELNKKIFVMVQIKLTEKETQAGIEPKKASELVSEIRKMKNLDARGYLAIAPIVENPEQLRPIFKKAKKLFDSDFTSTQTSDHKNYLSLGMSGDFEVAVEEGSNLPRIGSLIFGC
jgi:pyridoxal phosphate enzyme (YggS family)